ncbi:MAG: preprotein translocase subunit SecA [Dehalococcoidales bacterium]
MLKWLGKLVDSNEKELKQLGQIVDRINELEPGLKSLSDAELKAKTPEFKAQLAEATAKIRAELTEIQKELEKDRQQTDKKEELTTQYQRLEQKIKQLEKDIREVQNELLDELLPEAFALIRETANRVLGERHYDVQLMGGIILHQGKIAEMRTGEGKTLVATLPLYLNALSGRGCHLITVNDYLSKRDHHWMGPVFHSLGVTVGSIQHEASFIYDPEYKSEEDERWDFLRPVTRREAYEADIVYGTNNEFGFDYLRDNMVVDLVRAVQGPQKYAIVDEVDNILIDEARTPLIISGPAEEAGQKYEIFARLIPRLRQDEDYTLEEKHNSVALTEDGIVTIEGLLKREGLLQSPNLYDPENHALTRYMESALKAYVLFKRDRNYVVQDGQVVIVDEFTGRLMPGRRYSEGLHQAIEAKEKVKVQRETMTFATITFQNYFRMYDKLAGMTGTAITEAEEFYKIYKLEVVVIPTNRPMIREDSTDRVYKDENDKFRAAVREVEELHKKGQPVLIGTVSIDRSEVISELLKRKGIPHKVLNAKEHEKEASIITQAGESGAVTVATNMAGRGVDIVLGGIPEGKSQQEWQKAHDKVIELGGLFILGTERHEARRIDNQLRGRAGRQGDPGQSRFYVSLEDDVVARFGGERIKGIMAWAGMDDDTPIENKLISRSIENAQVKVEGYHFDLRKHLVEYDDVVNQQRTIIYGERRKILSGADLKTNILSMITSELEGIFPTHIGNGYEDEHDIEALIADVSTILPLPPELNAKALALLDSDEIASKVIEQAEALYERREQEIGAEDMRVLERLIMLRTIDSLWIEHLTAMEHMRLEAGWQSLRQVKAVDAYKSEGFKQFQVLLETIQHDVAHTIFHSGITRKEAPRQAPSPMARAAAASAGATATGQRPKASGKKVGRNDPCPCGSGKKFKHCHGN